MSRLGKCVFKQSCKKIKLLHFLSVKASQYILPHSVFSASVLLLFLKGRYHPLKTVSRDCQMPEVTWRSYISIFGKVLCVTADRGFIFNPFWMHSQNEQKMPFGVFQSTQPSISHQSGHRLENSSAPLHLIHFTVVKQVMVFPQKHNQIVFQADFDWSYFWY